MICMTLEPHTGSVPFPSINRLGTVIDKLTALKVGLGDAFIEFKHVLEPFPAPVLLTDANAHIIYANPAWEKLTGYKLEEADGKNPRILKSDKTETRVFTAMWKKLVRGKPFVTENIIDVRKDGTEFYTNSIIFPIRQSNVNLFYVQLEQDITNRKKLDELKREFLSAATHELKTPITILKLLIESQIRKMLHKQFSRVNIQDLRLITKELDRLTNIVNDLSDVSRIDAGKMRINPHELRLGQLIHDTVTQMRLVSDGHKITISSLSHVLVMADEDKIKQVLINLIKNALKYSFPNTEIFVKSVTKENQYVVSVLNTGPAIPKMEYRSIFDRFYLIKNTHSTGMGLGLYIAKKIIKLHKGKIWVQSVPGGFTTFSFSLRIA